LGISPGSAGAVTVSINKAGIESGGKSVTVYKSSVNGDPKSVKITGFTDPYTGPWQAPLTEYSFPGNFDPVPPANSFTIKTFLRFRPHLIPRSPR
jgi:hypothetical protein